MKSFDVIVHRWNGAYRASVPSLPHITTEGATRDDALIKAQEAIEAYFDTAEVVTLSMDVPVMEFRPSATANDHLRREALYPWPEDDEVNAQHLIDIYAERRRDGEERQREFEIEELKRQRWERRLEEIARSQRDERMYREPIGHLNGEPK
jgi:predicted RNase H-like HicB family nuclease